VPGVAVKLSDSPGAVRRLGPELGEHNQEIYAGLLGLGSEELTHLRAAEVI
jgi:formyl-CoA transferase